MFLTDGLGKIIKEYTILKGEIEITTNLDIFAVDCSFNNVNVESNISSIEIGLNINPIVVDVSVNDTSTEVIA